MCVFQRSIFIVCMQTSGSSKVFALSKGYLLFQILILSEEWSRKSLGLQCVGAANQCHLNEIAFQILMVGTESHISCTPVLSIK